MSTNKALALLAILLLLPIPACTPQNTVQAPQGTAASEVPGAAATNPPGVIGPAATIPAPVQAAPPEITATWFLQDTITPRVYYAFFVRNPNPGLALENAGYQVVAYDASEAILSTDGGIIGVLFPGEQRAMSTEFGLSIPQGSTVSRISVQFTQSADISNSGQRGSPFTSEKVTFSQDQAISRITGIIQNHLNADVSPVVVTAIAYDAGGKIIGAGISSIAPGLALPAKGTDPVVVPIHKAGEPARVEFYPFIYHLGDITAAAKSNETLHIAAAGGSRDQPYSTSWGMVLENKDTKAHFMIQCRLIIYADNGQVLEIATKVFAVIFPGERLGISGYTNIPENTKVGRVEAQKCSGSTDETDFWGLRKAGLTGNPLAAGKPAYNQDLGGLISGIVTNAYGRDLNPITITAIAYDASGAIIGGWENTGLSIPANGQAAYTIPTGLLSPPAAIEIYPTLFMLPLAQ
jgi:hypothetical protein